MRVWAVLVASALLLGGCAGQPSGASAPGTQPPAAGDLPPPPPSATATPGNAGAETTEKYADFPYSAVGEVYDIVLEHRVEHFAQSAPERAAHADPLRAYLRRTHSKVEFIDYMVGLIDGHGPLFERARGKPELLETDEALARALNFTLKWSIDWADQLFFKGTVVYMRRYQAPDFTARLFEMARTFDEQVDIACIDQEVPASELPAGLRGDFELEPGDKVYAFSTQGYAFDNLFGRAGFVVVRDDRVVFTAVTIEN